MAAGPRLRVPGALQAHPDLRYTYRGRSVLVTDAHGAIVPSGPQGFHHQNTRFLSRLDLSIDDAPLRPFCGAQVASDALLAYAAVTTPNAATQAAGWPGAGVYAELTYAVGDSLRLEIRFRSHHPTQGAAFVLGMRPDADFADSEEAESGQRRQRAPIERVWAADTRELILRYGHPELDLATSVRVEEASGEVRHDGEVIRVPIRLAPRGTARLILLVHPRPDMGNAAAMIGRGATATAATRASAALTDELPGLLSSNASVARAWETAVHDLASLPLGLEPGPATPMAGLPLYQQFFGRDSLTVAWQSLLAMPGLARDTLAANAAHHGRVIDDWLDEEPGKMVHQARWGPLSALGEDPFLRYYGDYATVPDFLVVLGQYLAWTGDTALARDLLPAARAGLEWLERFADIDSDGWIEYVTRSSKGVKNQGWLDSGDAIVDSEGRIVANPIATSELQAYAYAGLGQAAFVALSLGDLGFGLDLLARARRLRAGFREAFWDEGLGTFVQALGPGKEPVRSVASNAGHLLAAGIVEPADAARVARRLMAPDMFSGWGVRTLSADHPAFDPFSYHRGSVWPVEQATIAFGFARYGRWQELHRLSEAFFEMADLFVASRLPEVVGGVQRDEQHGHPGIYPRSHEPQAWSASAVVLFVQALLGLRAVAPLGVLLVDPHLPAWLPDLSLQGLRVGSARLDVVFRRRAGDGRTDYEVTRRDGRVLVRRQAAGGALSRLGPLAG